MSGDPALLDAPSDWVSNADALRTGPTTHHLFYFKDETFECVAEGWEVELPANPSLQRTALPPAELAR